ncbi:hypothetical protein [Spirosoma sp.]|uniref:hypothetical protein n=1 Tax=Spirosoma sp. TaxID=1899569 RepID=UPI003B3AD323
MKHLIIIVLISVSTFAAAQSSSRLKTRIVDDNQTLSIQIDGNRNGQPLHYNQTFDVAGMTTLQKDVLKFRAFASQNVAPPLHDMAVSIATLVGVLSLVITVAIVGYQTRYRKRKLMANSE